MMGTPDKHDVTRIVISFTLASEGDASIAAATKLAAAIQAEVVGLLVEDETLLGLADQPFARVFAYGEVRPLGQKEMISAFARGAAQCRRALSEQAERERIKWSFACERGEFLEKIRSTVTAGDYLVIGGDLHGFGAQKLLDEVRSSPRGIGGVLVAPLHREKARAGPVIAIDDGDEKGEETIALASRIASVTGGVLCVFAVASTQAEAEIISSRARRLTNPKIEVRTHRFVPGAPQAIAAATSHFGASFVVADQEGEPFGDNKSALALLRAAKAPVLLLR